MKRMGFMMTIMLMVVLSLFALRASATEVFSDAFERTAGNDINTGTPTGANWGGSDNRVISNDVIDSGKSAKQTASGWSTRYWDPGNPISLSGKRATLTWTSKIDSTGTIYSGMWIENEAGNRRFGMYLMPDKFYAYVYDVPTTTILTDKEFSTSIKTVKFKVEVCADSSKFYYWDTTNSAWVMILDSARGSTEVGRIQIVGNNANNWVDTVSLDVSSISPTAFSDYFDGQTAGNAITGWGTGGGTIVYSNDVVDVNQSAKQTSAGWSDRHYSPGTSLSSRWASLTWKGKIGSSGTNYNGMYMYNNGLRFGMYLYDNGLWAYVYNEQTSTMLHEAQVSSSLKTAWMKVELYSWKSVFYYYDTTNKRWIELLSTDDGANSITDIYMVGYGANCWWDSVTLDINTFSEVLFQDDMSTRAVGSELSRDKLWFNGDGTNDICTDVIDAGNSCKQTSAPTGGWSEDHVYIYSTPTCDTSLLSTSGKCAVLTWVSKIGTGGSDYSGMEIYTADEKRKFGIYLRPTDFLAYVYSYETSNFLASAQPSTSLKTAKMKVEVFENSSKFYYWNTGTSSWVQILDAAYGANDIRKLQLNGKDTNWHDSIKVEVFPASKELQVPPGWSNSTVYHQNGTSAQIALDAKKQLVTKNRYREQAWSPSMVYQSDLDRILMYHGRGFTHAAFSFSDDYGATWSDPYWGFIDSENKLFDGGFMPALTDLGGGDMILPNLKFSTDSGLTWSATLPAPDTESDKTANISWSTMLADKDGSGNVTKLYDCRWETTGDPWGPGYSQAIMRFSYDGGETWEDEVKPAAWDGVNEVATLRLSNGNILAACRTDVLDGDDHDYFCGLGTIISTDNGLTWSAPVKSPGPTSNLNMLYAYGRHHPSLVQLADGKVVMTYVVREGYTNDASGYHRYGIEAVVSSDNGQTWDLDHRYILAVWSSTISGSYYTACGANTTSTVVLEDGSLLTCYGTGERIDPNTLSANYLPRDIGVVKWSLDTGSINSDNQIRSANWDSTTRNVFNPTP